MIVAAAAAGLLILLGGILVAWYRDSRLWLLTAVLGACALVGCAFVFRTAPGPRAGESAAIDDSCDSAPITSALVQQVETALAPALESEDAVALSWFAADARTSRRMILDLTAPPPAAVGADAVAQTNWQHGRVEQAQQALARVKSHPCLRIGTSIVGAAEAANDVLAEAGVRGRRRIVLATNLVEFTPDLRIKADRFGIADVPGAVAAIAQLPRLLRPPLGPQVSVEILFTPVVREGALVTPLAGNTAVALEAWARRVFRDVLHAGSVRIVVVDQGAARP